MKKHRFTVFGILMILTAVSLQGVIITDSYVEVDFDDFYSGTLVGYENRRVDRQLYSSSNAYSPLDNGMGFDIHIDSNGNCDVGTFYDTDRRLYDTSSNGSSQSYYDLPGSSPVATDSGRLPGTEGQGAVGEDPDLEYDTTGGWTEGNLQNQRQGNALIIQENFGIAKWKGSVSNSPSAISRGHLYFTQGQHNWGTNNNWQKYAPDDNASGGSITFDFETNINSFGFNFIDLDGSEGATITFTDSTGITTTVGFDQFEAGGSFQQGAAGSTDEVVWQNGAANRINPISVADVNSTLNTNLSNFESVTINLTGSGGISQIRYGFSTPVPEASTVASAAGIVLLIGFHFFRTYRKRKAA